MNESLDIIDTLKGEIRELKYELEIITNGYNDLQNAFNSFYKKQSILTEENINQYNEIVRLKRLNEIFRETIMKVIEKESGQLELPLYSFRQ